MQDDNPHWIALRWSDSSTIRMRSNALQGLTESQYSQLEQAMRQADRVIWHRPYPQSDEQLSALVTRAQRRREQRLPNLNQRMDAAVYGVSDLNALLTSLQTLEFIEYALAIPDPVPPPQMALNHSASVPNFVSNQGYLLEAPTGVGALVLHEVEGVRGHGVRIVDIEYDFNADHEDLPHVAKIGGQPFTAFGDDHGTAVLGQLGALDNEFGVTGLAPDSELMFHYAHNTQGVWSVGAAVIGSLSHINPGDIIVIEQQIQGPNYDSESVGQYGLVPVEWFRPWYEDIVFAVEWGAIVIMAAGNGNQDLDGPEYSTGNSAHYPFRPENDSGAIIVGAGAAPATFGGWDVARSRLWFSNYGSRVNLQGWGRSVATTGYGDAYDQEDPNLHFTLSFSGTSSATPIVAGAAALVQSWLLKQGKPVLTSGEMRDLLRSTGSSQQSGIYDTQQNIGPLPDAVAAISNLVDGSDRIFHDRFEAGVFQDCPQCPTMVMIPAGSFVQGSPASEPQSQSTERPQRTVTVPAFAMGKTAVTFDEWDACVADSGCTHDPGDQGWGRGNRPVINISLNDAQEYVDWLKEKTGKEYRLPSESEWEYATRAGTTTRFNTGDCITTAQANFGGFSPAEGCPTGVQRSQTLPVGSFSPNAYGLYDTHGNTWEWVQDCWNTSYNSAPIDGSAWMTGDCTFAVLRGGSWVSLGYQLRSADRFAYLRGGRNSSFGFRVSLTVKP